MLLILDNIDFIYEEENAFRLNLDLLMKKHRHIKVLVTKMKEIAKNDREDLMQLKLHPMESFDNI